MEKTNLKISLLALIVLAVFCFAVAFPSPFNKAINFANLKVLKHIGLSAPFVPDIPFKLGLDLQGGSHLTYEADLSGAPEDERSDSMAGIRDVIERRINLFGVSEPIVHIEESGGHQRLVVELPGVKDTKQAIEMIGKTPFLEFREERDKEETEKMLKDFSETALDNGVAANIDPYYKATLLTGKYLKKATLGFNENTLEPEVLLEFNSEGAKIFEDLTVKNVGEQLAIYIDNIPISAPVIREPISGGKAQITGRFTLEEAKELVRDFNAGALPVPISLISQTTVGPTLGKISLEKSLKAALYGFLAVVLFMVVVYRFSGFLAGLSLILYCLILLSIFKLLPVTLTLASIGGAVLSVGMAVDANVLIFERRKEEIKAGESFSRALFQGFSRAWPSIRDGNFTTLLIAVIMFSFGTSFVKGFALTLTLGILTSMFSALFATRVFLKMFIGTKLEHIKKLWG